MPRRMKLPVSLLSRLLLVLALLAGALAPAAATAQENGGSDRAISIGPVRAPGPEVVAEQREKIGRITRETDRLETRMRANVEDDGVLVEVITPPITPYGMTVDSKGRVWLAAWTGSGPSSAARYDPSNLSWALANNHIASSMSGIQEDAQGRMWMNYWTYDGSSANPGLVYIDGDTMQVSEPFGIGCGNSACRGISVDLDGNVWSTSMAQNMAFRFDPGTLAVDTYGQLQGPYTYSDMTGWALQNTSCAPPG